MARTPVIPETQPGDKLGTTPHSVKDAIHKTVTERVRLRVFDIWDYAAVGNDVADDTTPFTNLFTDVIAAGGGTVLVSRGGFYVPAGIVVPSGIKIEVIGDGRSFLRCDQDDTRILTFSGTGSELSIEGLDFNCDGDALSTGRGAIFVDGDYTKINIEGCNFYEHAEIHAVDIQNGAGDLAEVIKIDDCDFEGGIRTSGDVAGVGPEYSDIHIVAEVRMVRVRDTRHRADATNPSANAVFVAAVGADRIWHDVIVEGARIDGYGKRGVALADEDGTTLTTRDRAGTVRDCRIINTVMSGIKTKGSSRFWVTDNYLEACDSSPEIAGNLQGSIIFGLRNHGVCSGNQIFGGGTDGIRVRGGDPALGFDSGDMVCEKNIIHDCDESGIYVEQRLRRLDIKGNHCKDNGGQGIRLVGQSGTPADHIRNAQIIGNQLHGNFTDGINATLVDGLLVRSNIIKDNGNLGIQISSIDEGKVENNQVSDNGQNATGTMDGIRFTSCTDLDVIANRSGNRDGATQRYGISTGGSNTRARVIDNNCDNNATGGTNALISSNGVVDVRGNRGDVLPAAANVVPGASPYTYTAEEHVESVAITGGTVSNITFRGQSIAAATGYTAELRPGEQIVITYSVAPTIRRIQHV